MAKKTKINESSGCCSSGDAFDACCKVESLLSIDERGQMVLPKNVRDKAGIKPGDKIGLVTWEKNGKVCCIVLVKADDLGAMARNMLGPILKEM